MLRQVMETGKSKHQIKFQVLFLHNDTSQQVEVHDVKQVDFQTIQEALEHGESVFITAKATQKIKAPKNKPTPRNLKTRLATAFSFETA